MSGASPTFVQKRLRTSGASAARKQGEKQRSLVAASAAAAQNLHWVFGRPKNVVESSRLWSVRLEPENGEQQRERGAAHRRTPITIEALNLLSSLKNRVANKRASGRRASRNVATLLQTADKLQSGDETVDGANDARASAATFNTPRATITRLIERIESGAKNTQGDGGGRRVNRTQHLVHQRQRRAASQAARQREQDAISSDQGDRSAIESRSSTLVVDARL